MRGKPYRLVGKLGSKDIMAILNISSRTFYRYMDKGLFQGLVKKDVIANNYYLEPADLPKLRKIINF